MSWAHYAKKSLLQGKVTQIRPKGHSMKGKVKSGACVTLVPIDQKTVLQTGDIVLVRVRGKDYLHLIHAYKDKRFLIGNNRGGINGWVGRNAIFGLATHIDNSTSSGKK